MNKRISLFFLLFFSITFGFAQKDTCTLGIYIHSLYDFELEDNSFMADFWIWQTYKSDSLNFENAVEITNSKSVDFSHYSHEKKAGINWVAQKCKAQMMQHW